MLHNFGGDISLGGNLNVIFNELRQPLLSHVSKKLLDSKTRTEAFKNRFDEEDAMFFKGIGLAMEGINQNEILYLAALEHSYDIYDNFYHLSGVYDKDNNNYDKDNIDVEFIWNHNLGIDQRRDYFLHDFVRSRYGNEIYQFNNYQIKSIWDKMAIVFYQTPLGSWTPIKSVITKRPNDWFMPTSRHSIFKLNIVDKGNINVIEFPLLIDETHSATRTRQYKRGGGFQPTTYDHSILDTFTICNEWMIDLIKKNLLNNKANDDNDNDLGYLFDIEIFKYDTIMLLRQLLVEFYYEMMFIWRDFYSKYYNIKSGKYNGFNFDTNGNENIISNPSDILLGIIDDLDIILAFNDELRLDTWINRARNFGVNKMEKDYYEYNARNLITRWGPNAEISDYASREWHQLMKTYYKQRWKIYLNAMESHQDNRGGSVDKGAIMEKIKKFETKWEKQTIDDLTKEYQNSDKSSDVALTNEEVFARFVTTFEKYAKYIPRD